MNGVKVAGRAVRLDNLHRGHSDLSAPLEFIKVCSLLQVLPLE